MMCRIFTVVAIFIAVALLSLVTVYFLTDTYEINVFGGGKCIKQGRNLFANRSVCLFNNDVALASSLGLRVSSSLHRAGDIMAPTITEDTEPFLTSILTKEVEDKVVRFISYVPVLLVGLWKLFAVYKNKTEFTQEKVNELREQLQEQEDRHKALLTEHRMAKLAVKRYCSRGCRRCNCKADPKRNKTSKKGRTLGKAKNIAVEFRKLLPLTENRFETCDVSDYGSFNPDDQSSSVLYEHTGHNSFSSLKLNSDVAAARDSSCPSKVVLGYSNDQTCNCSTNGISFEHQSASSFSIATFRPSKTMPRSSDKMPAATHLLDSSAAEPSAKVPVVSTDAQPICNVEWKLGRPLPEYPQIDVAVKSISDTFSTNASTMVSGKTANAVCNNALRPSAWKNHSLDMLSSFLDNETATVSTSARFCVRLKGFCSMPLLVAADFAATVQTTRCSQSWTDKRTALRTPRSTNTSSREILVSVSFKGVSCSMEDLHSRCDKYAEIDRVYSSSWSPGYTVVTQHYKSEAFWSSEGQLSGRNVRPIEARRRIKQSENNIFDIDIFGSPSCSRLTSSENMPQKSRALHQNLVRGEPGVMESYQHNPAVEIPGADFDQYSSIGSFGVSSFGSNLSQSSGFQSETSSIDSELERELFGDPFDVVQARPSPPTLVVDLAGLMTSNQSQIPQTSTPFVCTDNYCLAAAEDESSFWFEDSPSSSLDSDLKRAFLDDPDTMMSRRLLKSCDSNTSPESFNLDPNLKSSSDIDASSDSSNFNTNSESSDSDSNSEFSETDTNSESIEFNRLNLQQKIFKDQKSMIPKHQPWSARSLPMNKNSSCQFVKRRNISHPGQEVLRRLDFVVPHCVPMLPRRPMSNCSFTSHSSAYLPMPSNPSQLSASGAFEIWSEIAYGEDASSGESVESQILDEPQIEILTEKPSEDQLPQNELQEHLTSEEESNESDDASRGSDGLRKVSPAVPALDAFVHRRHSGEAEAYLSLQSLSSPVFTRLPRYLHPIRALLQIDLSAVVTQRDVIKSGQSSDSSGYFCTYVTTPSDSSVRIVSWRLWKGAEISKTLRRILVDIYGPPPSGVSDDAFTRGLKKAARNDGLASVISAKAPASARRALLQSLETRDDLSYSTYQLELFTQIAALNEWNRVKFCSETQRKNKLALGVLERKKDGLKAALSSSNERPKKAFVRFLKALKRIGKFEKPGEELRKVCRDISALRAKIDECFEVWDEVQEQRRRSLQRRQFQERILEYEKALVDCVRRALTLRSKMKRRDSGVLCYDCNAGRHEIPMIAPIFSSPPVLGEHNGFSCDCPLIQNINASYDALGLDSRGLSNATKLDRIRGFLKRVQAGVFRKCFLLNGQIAL